jgi:hypothetical protein
MTGPLDCPVASGSRVRLTGVGAVRELQWPTKVCRCWRGASCRWRLPRALGMVFTRLAAGGHLQANAERGDWTPSGRASDRITHHFPPTPVHGQFPADERRLRGDG